MRIFLAALASLFLSMAYAQTDALPACSVTIKGTPRVEWTAYKFSEKKAVKGEIKNAEFTAPEVTTVDELISHISFVINPAKVDSGDAGRDTNLRDSFFKLMKGSGTIRGHVVAFDKAASTLKVQVNMNGVTKMIPFRLTQEALSSVTKTSSQKKISGKSETKSKIQSKEKSHLYVAEGEIDVLDFRMKKSLDALNKVCLDLHKGADGVVKTWSQVNLTISGEISETCNNGN